MTTINISKGLIGVEDIYTGTAATFSRLKSDGSSQTMTKLTSQQIGGLSVYNVKEYGAVGDSVAGVGTDDTDAIQAALDAAYDAGGGLVWLPRSTGHYLTTFQIEVGSNTIMQWEGGSYIHRKPNSDTTVHATLPNRGTVILMRKTGTHAHDVTLLNPLVDGGDNQNMNGIAIGSGQEITDGPAPITNFAERMLVLGGHVRNCAKGTTNNGGRALTSQIGTHEIIFSGVHVSECAVAMDASGNNFQDKFCTEIIFDGITVRDCGPLIETGSFNGAAAVDSGTPENMHVRFSNIQAKNCGKSSYKNNFPGYTEDDGKGVISCNGGFYCTFENISIANDSTYPTIGGLFRGKYHHFAARNINFIGNCEAIINSESLTEDAAGGGPGGNHPEYHWKDNTFQDIRHWGTANYAIKTAAYRSTGLLTDLNNNNRIGPLYTDVLTLGIQDFDSTRSTFSFMDVIDRDSGARRSGRCDLVATRGTPAYTGTLQLVNGSTAVEGSTTIPTAFDTELTVGDLIAIEDSQASAPSRKVYRIVTITDLNTMTIENPNAAIVGYEGTSTGASEANFERFYKVNNDYSTAPAVDFASQIRHGMGSLTVVQSNSANRITIRSEGNEEVAIQGIDGSLTKFREGTVVPSYSTTARDAITTPNNGAIIYNSTTSKLNIYIAGGWAVVATV